MNMIKYNAKRKIISAAVTALLIWTAVWPTISVKAEGQDTLKVAQYVKSTDLQKQTDGSYKGEWQAEIPMSQLMQPYEDMMREYGNNFPWDPATCDTSASIYYEVKFPQGVNLAQPTHSSNSAMFSNNEISYSKTATSYKFRLKLQDANWGQIYQSYLADKQNNSLVKLSVPYTLTAEQYEKFRQEQAKIEGNGDFSFCASGTMCRWGMGKKSFLTDKAYTPLLGGKSESQDVKTLPDAVINLNADLEVNGDTQNKAIYQTEFNKPLTLTGKLQVRKIQELLQAIETSFNKQQPVTERAATADSPKSAADKIAVENLETLFVAQLTLPQGLSFNKEQKPVLSGDNGQFAITGSSYSNQDKTLKVEMSTTDTGNIKTFADLKKHVLGADEFLKVSIAGVHFDASSKPNTPYQIVGKISGKFSGCAKLGETKVKFNFNWNGVQDKDSKDSTVKDNNEQILLTVSYVKTAPESTPPTAETSVPVPTVTKDEGKIVTTKPRVAKTGELVSTATGWGVLLTVAAACLLRHKRQN